MGAIVSEKTRLALVTGANRGIGFEIARGLGRAGVRVLVAARTRDKAGAAALKLAGENLDVAPAVLDVAAAADIPARIAELEAAHGGIDILVNNAAILIDQPGGFSAKLVDMTDDVLRTTFETNVVGPAALIRAVLPGMIERGYGRIVNVSSRAGQLEAMGGGFPAYRISKAALNALTRVAAAEAASATDVKVNCASPGRVRTQMGGEGATRSPAEGADTATWLALLPHDGPTGGFFHDREQIAW